MHPAFGPMVGVDPPDMQPRRAERHISRFEPMSRNKYVGTSLAYSLDNSDMSRTARRWNTDWTHGIVHVTPCWRSELKGCVHALL
jgi:hypothetical protein